MSVHDIHDSFLERLNLFVKKIKSSNRDIESFPGLSRQSRAGYKARMSLPKGDILLSWATHFDLNVNWLLTGNGPMFTKERFPPPLSAKNRTGKYTGEILHEALGILKMTEEEASKKSGLNEEMLLALLDSRVKPAFEQLEALYMKLGVNPVCFFDNSTYWRVLPHDQLLLALAAVGYAGREPTDMLLAEVFSISHEEAESFLRVWEKDRKNGGNTFLPNHWFDHLARDYGIEPGWLMNRNAPIARRRENSDVAPDRRVTPVVEEGQTEAFLRQRVKDLERLIAAQEESLRLYREKEAAPMDAAPPQWLGDSEKPSAPGMDSVAPSSRGETE